MKIVNNSNSVIYFYNSFSYPDTTINFVFNPIQSPEFYKIDAGGTESNQVTDTWEDQFKYIDTLMIFIFDEEILQTVPWDSIQEKYMILKRYDLSYDDLVKVNWRITFP